MADGRHIENRYISIISQPQIVWIWQNLVYKRIFWRWWQNVTKKSEIRKFKMADGRHSENHFGYNLAPVHIAQLRLNLEWGGTIARIRRSGDENVQFRKSNMADGAILKIVISEPQIVRIWENLVYKRMFWPWRRKCDKIQKFANSRWRTDAILRIIVWLELGSILSD